MPTEQEEKKQNPQKDENSIAKDTGKLIEDTIKKFENDKSAKKGVEMLKSIKDGNLNSKGKIKEDGTGNVEMRSHDSKYTFHLGNRLNNLKLYYAKNENSSKDSKSDKEIKGFIREATEVMHAAKEGEIDKSQKLLTELTNKVQKIEPQKEKSRSALIEKAREIGNKLRKSNNKVNLPEEGVEQKQKAGRLAAAKKKFDQLRGR